MIATALPGPRSRPSESAVRRNGRMASYFSSLGGLRFFYQAIVELRSETRAVAAIECLARGPKGTPLENPEKLIQFFRDRGDGADMDGYCVFSALLDAVRIPGEPMVAVNVQCPTAADPAFPGRLGRLVDAAGIPPSRLVLDIGLGRDDVDEAVLSRCVKELCRAGFRVCFDEESAFVSPFSLLVDAAPDFVKLHRSVLASLRNDTWAANTLEAACSLGRRVGFRIIAEGIEEKADLDSVLRFDVDLGQGYLLSRPVERASVGRQRPAEAIQAAPAWTSLYRR